MLLKYAVLKLIYLARCLTGGEGGCRPCLGHTSDRWSLDLLTKTSSSEPCKPIDFVCSLVLRVDLEDRPNPVDTVAMVPVPLSSDCSATFFERNRNEQS